MRLGEEVEKKRHEGEELKLMLPDWE